MRIHSLQARFVMAGSLLVLITLVGGIWSVALFARLSSVVGETLRLSQETIELAARLSGALEREDDAFVMALNGKVRNARSEVAQQRQDFDDAYARLFPRLEDPEEQEAARDLRTHVDAYRQAGNALLARASQPGAREIYDQRVNPALRKAVADCGRIRELTFRTMQQLGLDLRGDAVRSTGIVAGIALVALGLCILIMLRLAHGILRPVYELSRSVEAIRRDDFKARVHVDSDDELGQLGEGFNRMAERLGDYRESSLGELLAAKSTLEATLAALPDAVVVADPDGRIVSRNPLAARVLKALGGKEDAERVVDLPLPAPVLRDVEQSLRDGRPSVARQDLGRALPVALDGRTLKMLVSVVPIPNFELRRAGAAIVLADVTDFARLDELRSEVVAVASHELKTPLTSLQMNLLMLKEKDDNLTPRQREILATAVEGSEELGATIDELLDLTRIEAGQLQLARQRVDVGALVEQVARSLRPRFADADVRLQISNEAAPALVLGDPARLKIVIANLLTNALKYSPRGGNVTVRLASGQNAGPGGKPRLQITVSDQGPGIPADLRERVFEKFFRAEDGGSDGPKGVRGTGIGLYLCREIIEAHGGAISAQAGEGGGTRIAISLDRE